MNKENMKKLQTDQIQTAAEEFAEAIKVTVGKHSRVVVFYNYLDHATNEWVSGDAGNQNWLERVGSLRFLITNTQEGNN